MDTYSHWGSLALGDGSSKVPEPNNQYPPEYCVAANYSMAGADKIWSWADTNCTAGLFPYICKITREWRWHVAALCCAPHSNIAGFVGAVMWWAVSYAGKRAAQTLPTMACLQLPQRTRRSTTPRPTPA